MHITLLDYSTSILFRRHTLTRTIRAASRVLLFAKVGENLGKNNWIFGGKPHNQNNWAGVMNNQGSFLRWKRGEIIVGEFKERDDVMHKGCRKCNATFFKDIENISILLKVQHFFWKFIHFLFFKDLPTFCICFYLFPIFRYSSHIFPLLYLNFAIGLSLKYW